MNLGGTVWLSLIVALTAWVQQSFPEYWWSPGVVVLLGAVGKLVELYWKDDVTPSGAQGSPRMAAPSRSKLSRFLLG